MKLLTIIRQENWYIVTTIDYFIKWLMAKALKEITAKAINSFIYKKIIYKHGCPKIF